MTRGHPWTPLLCSKNVVYYLHTVRENILHTVIKRNAEQKISLREHSLLQMHDNPFFRKSHAYKRTNPKLCCFVFIPEFHILDNQ
jgi:hypothetical protein